MVDATLRKKPTRGLMVLRLKPLLAFLSNASILWYLLFTGIIADLALSLDAGFFDMSLQVPDQQR